MKGLLTRRHDEVGAFDFVVALPRVRPSLFDPMLHLDLWLEPCPGSDLHALFLHNRPIALIPASPLDFAALNQQLMQLRQRGVRCDYCATSS